MAIAGEIMTMPGLPRVPAATKITLNEEGNIEGLFSFQKSISALFGRRH